MLLISCVKKEMYAHEILICTKLVDMKILNGNTLQMFVQ